MAKQQSKTEDASTSTVPRHPLTFCPPVNDLDEGGESDEKWPVEKGAAADVNR